MELNVFSRRMIVVSLIFLGLLALIPVATRLFYVPWSQTKAVKQYRGRYFRMTVKLEYHGEPQLFDMVVGCNVRSTIYQDNSRSRDVGLVPDVYGRRMKDNKAVVVTPPDVCDGEVSDTGEVPPGFMPLIMVYDNADTLDQGLAYLSDDAYASPHSDMKFGSAEIHAATEAEFKEFMDHGVPNLITREMYWSPQSNEAIEALGLVPIDPPVASRCYFAERYELPSIAREKAREIWPSTHPEYWFASTWQQIETVTAFRYNKSKAADAVEATWIPVGPPWGKVPLSEFRKATVDRGMARHHIPFRIVPRELMGLPSSNADYPVVEYYPYFWALPPRYEYPSDRAAWAEFISARQGSILQKIDYNSGEWRGFAACSSVVSFTRQGFSEKQSSELIEQYNKLRGAFAVDTHIVDRSEGNVLPIGARNGQQVVFQRDHAMFVFGNVGFGTFNGDVK